MTRGERPIDAWTLVHLAAGVASGAAGVPAWAAMAGAVIYEIAENSERGAVRRSIFGASGPETNANVVLDLVAFGGGFALGRRLRDHAQKT